MRNECQRICEAIIGRARHAVTRCVRDQAEVVEFMEAVTAGLGEVAAEAEKRLRKIQGAAPPLAPVPAPKPLQTAEELPDEKPAAKPKKAAKK